MHQVGSPAQLLGIVADGHHPDGLPILFPEERQGAKMLGLVQRHGRRLDLIGSPHPLVDQLLNLHLLLLAQGLQGRKIKSHALGVDQRSGLDGFRTQHLAQCPMQQMGTRMAARHFQPMIWIDLTPNGIVDLHRSVRNPGVMHQQVVHPLRIHDLHGSLRRVNRPTVTNLPTGLAVERRAIKHQPHMIAQAGSADPLILLPNPFDVRLGLQGLVSHELDRNRLRKFQGWRHENIPPKLARRP